MYVIYFRCLHRVIYDKCNKLSQFVGQVILSTKCPVSIGPNLSSCTTSRKLSFISRIANLRVTVIIERPNKILESFRIKHIV